MAFRTSGKEGGGDPPAGGTPSRPRRTTPVERKLELSFQISYASEIYLFSCRFFFSLFSIFHPAAMTAWLALSRPAPPPALHVPSPRALRGAPGRGAVAPQQAFISQRADAPLRA